MPKRKLVRLLRDTTGGIAVVTALTLPVFVGGLGMGSEAGYWYFNQRKLQDAADVAAYAGAAELRAGRTSAQISAAATDAATQTGHVAALGKVTASSPPASGAHAGDEDAVEVTVAEQLPRTFSGLFLDGDVSLAGRAVALLSPGVQTCVLALDPTAQKAVNFTGNTSTILVGCNVHANSLADNAVTVTGSAAVKTDCVSAGGQVAADSGLILTKCSAPYETADIVPDPFADLPVPSTNVPNQSIGKSTTLLLPGLYKGGMKIQGSVTMQPGTYVIQGDFAVNAQATVTGQGVTLYLTNGGTLQINGGATMTLHAPQSGTYAGVLIFVDRSNTGKQTINGNSSSTFNGAIYAAGGMIDVNGGSSNKGGCSQVVARTITFSGNSGIAMDCGSTFMRDIRSSRLITLVE